MIRKGHGIEQNWSTLGIWNPTPKFNLGSVNNQVGLNHPAIGNLCTMLLIVAFPSMYGSAKRIEILMEA
jgi:hypothetical protein